MTINQSTVVEVYNSELEQWENITNGILSIDTVTGSDSFQGFWDQPDTGQFVITSRGATADPQLHSYIKSNALINITINEQTVFAGFITDVNVKYNKNDKQIVTINGTDLIGYLNRLVVTQDFIDTQITPTYPTGLVPVDYLLEVCTYALAPEIQNFFYIAYASKEDFVQLTDPISSPSILPDTAKVKVEPGKTLYELIASGMSTGLMRYECVDARKYYFMPYFKYDYSFYSTFWDEWYAGSFMYFARTNEEDPWQVDIGDFSHEITYKEINLNNGLNKMINQVAVNNTDPATQESLFINPVSNEQSVQSYGPAKLDSYTGFTTTSNPFLLPTSTIAEQAEIYQNNIIEYQSEPSTTIEYVSIDMNKYYDLMNVPFNGSRIFVQHNLGNDEYVTGYFVVSGVKNKITADQWTCELILRKSEHELYVQKRPKTPTITLSATSGDTNDTFTASIGNYTSGDWANVAKIEWQVNYLSGLNAIPGNPPSQINTSWPTFTNNTVSWTYDDNGVLEGYPAEYYGPGTYAVVVWVTNHNGYVTSVMSEDISIIGATAHADFLFTKDASENVTFTDNSGTDTNTWSWNFGDGTTYSGKTPPVKVYATSGTYNVTLTVNNGFNTSTITKPVTISIYQMPVQFIRLRYKGTVTKPAGQEDYTTDLIDTIGLVELMNTSNQQTGGIQPMYVQPKTCEKVEDIGKGQINTSAYAYNPLSTYEVITELGPIDSWQCPNPEDPANPFNITNYTYYNREQIAPVRGPYNSINYSPYYTTNYNSGGPLDPMSQSMRSSYNSTITRGTYGGQYPKYKFHPVITNNPDGSETKSIDVDLVIWYSQTYITGTSSNGSTSAWRNWFTNTPSFYSASDDPNNPTAITESIAYLPAGTPSRLAYWSNWGSGGVGFDERLKLKEIKIWPGKEISIINNINTSSFLPGNRLPDCTQDSGGLHLDVINKIGVNSVKTYLPIEISVSEDGSVYRKVGEATYTGGNVMSTTYTTTMPPLSNAPIQT